MGTGTKARIVKIGNSQGIRIPKLLLDQTDIREAVELEVQGGAVGHPSSARATVRLE